MLKRKLSAFTLIETIFVLTLIVSVSALFLANYRSNEDLYERKKVIVDFATDIDTAVYRVLGSYNKEEIPFNFYGWGLYISNTRDYYIFPCLNENYCCFLSENLEQPQSEYLISKSLPDDMVFDKIERYVLNEANGTVSQASVSIAGFPEVINPLYHKFSLGFFYPRSDHTLTAEQANGLLDITSCVSISSGTPAGDSQDDVYKIYIKTEDELADRTSVINIHRGGLVDYQINN